MEEFIRQYGYWFVLLGSFVEGESVVLTAGFLAHQGYLSLPGIIAVSFMGSLFADQLLFHVGRHYGKRTIERIADRYPIWHQRVDRAFDLLHRYDVLFIISFRFIYGIRTISPVIIGASRIPVWRFTWLNVLSAAVWAILSCSAGYLMGEAFEELSERFGSNARFIGLGVILCLVAIVCGVTWWQRRRQKNSS